MKYPEGIHFQIVNLNGVKSSWKFPQAGSSLNDCEKIGELKIGDEVILMHKRIPTERFQYYLEYDSGLESDWMSENEIEIMMGQEFIEHYDKNNKQEKHTVKSKPPLGVISKDIYEYKRIQDLTRAIHEYIDFGSRDYDLLIEWTDELLDRLYELKERE